MANPAKTTPPHPSINVDEQQANLVPNPQQTWTDGFTQYPIFGRVEVGAGKGGIWYSWATKEITSKRGCLIKRRHRRRIPPFWGVIRVAHPKA